MELSFREADRHQGKKTGGHAFRVRFADHARAGIPILLVIQSSLVGGFGVYSPTDQGDHLAQSTIRKYTTLSSG
ncbi:MAG: hypothetical protein ABSF71_16435 [Terriglobia bacterium]